MDLNFFQPLFVWVDLHPALAGVVVFLVAMSESLVIVGLIVPGILLMFGIGALIGAGNLEFGATLAWTFCGAVAGDGISFIVGRYYKESLPRLWPFRAKPQLLQTGFNFFTRHGGKSIVFGRFVGPVRPIIPAVAGMLDMRPGKFFTFNILSAALWSPLMLLPGMAFGTSLGLASEVASRLVFFIVVIFAVFLAIFYLTKKLVLFFSPRIDFYLDKFVIWSFSHRFVGVAARSLVDSSHPEVKGLAATALMLLVAIWTFATLTLLVVDDMANVIGNIEINAFFQSLRTPLADSVLVAIIQMANPLTIAIVVLGQFSWLYIRHYRNTAWHWIIVIGVGISSVFALQWLLALPSPIPATLNSFYAYPSWNIAVITITFGFIAAIVNSGVALRQRWIAYVVANSAILFLAVACLYFGLNWFSDILAGLLFGFILVAAFVIAYRRHQPDNIPRRSFLAVFLGLLIVGWSVSIYYFHERDLDRVQVAVERQPIDSASWWKEDWKRLPLWRKDLVQSERRPFTVQWMASEESISSRLVSLGWTPAPPFKLKETLSWFIANPRIDTLPVLPHVHNGQHETLQLVKVLNHETELVIRFWPSGKFDSSSNHPLWLGELNIVTLHKSLHLLSFPRSSLYDEESVRNFYSTVAGNNVKLVSRVTDKQQSGVQTIETVLIGD